MGTSLAITRAYVIAGELSKLDDGEHLSKALEAYESTFRPSVEDMQKIPYFVNKCHRSAKNRYNEMVWPEGRLSRSASRSGNVRLNYRALAVGSLTSNNAQS